MLCSVAWAELLPRTYSGVYYVCRGVYIGSDNYWRYLLVDGGEYYGHSTDDPWPDPIVAPPLEFRRNGLRYSFTHEDGEIQLCTKERVVARFQSPPSKHPWSHLDILWVNATCTELTLWYGMYMLGIHIQWL